ncbi:hypothetical protein [Nonomuraea cavernae]|uniref:Uncharacterized protein n=1 Tax=Nonomuraea cavernae TaxID=2045107 RepID=A0A917ZKF6_9ACTN|nr:hypothetical protein [Nonomuraea cavernae]MCA2190959.1 hypothetical protein [Nonomuraea cavernae]GGO83462.1 hypothetical protein GCM10012289_76970 [Nonomuraea cavernae]
MSDVDKMRELLADYESQRQRESSAFEEGFRLGWEHGLDVGRGQAEVEIEAAWVALAEKVRKLGKGGA